MWATSLTIHAIGEGQQHTSGAESLSELVNGMHEEIAHSPVTVGSADLIQEIAEHLGPNSVFLASG